MAAAALFPVPHPWRTSLVQGILDFSHFLLAGLAFWFLKSRLGLGTWPAFVLVVAAAGACEIAQGFTGRCPGMADFLRGVLGASAAVICLGVWVPSRHPLHRVVAGAAAAAVSVWPVAEFLAVAADSLGRSGAGPV